MIVVNNNNNDNVLVLVVLMASVGSYSIGVGGFGAVLDGQAEDERQ